jgi:hypothetical protein
MQPFLVGLAAWRLCVSTWKLLNLKKFFTQSRKAAKRGLPISEVTDTRVGGGAGTRQ